MAQRPGDGGRRADVPGWARPVLAACLLAVVAAGLRVTVPAPALNGPFRHDGLAVGVVLEAEHTCMTQRGIRAHGATTVTSALLGTLRTDPRSRAEFFALARVPAPAGPM